MAQETIGTFTAEDIAFINDIDSVERGGGHRLSETIKHDWVRNLDQSARVKFEDIYKRVINKKFVLCYHCNSEVLPMLKRVFDAYKAFQGEMKASEKEEIKEEVPPVEIAKDADGNPIIETVTTEKPKKKHGN